MTDERKAGREGIIERLRTAPEYSNLQRLTNDAADLLEHIRDRLDARKSMWLYRMRMSSNGFDTSRAKQIARELAENCDWLDAKLEAK